jgi:hypothetical protein
MATHFLGHVRSRYNLHTSQLTDEFAQKLAYKSAYPLPLINELFTHIKLLEEMPDMTDDELLAFSDKIDTFINKQ